MISLLLPVHKRHLHMDAPNITIITAELIHMDTVRTLFREYHDDIGGSCCFEGFNEELAHLPGDYAPPKGAIYIALKNKKAVACVALKPCETCVNSTENSEAELKRLYVQKTHRGERIGQALLETAMQAAKTIGYHAVVLETIVEQMPAAQQLYRDYGFVPDSSHTNYCSDDDITHLRYTFKEH